MDRKSAFNFSLVFILLLAFGCSTVDKQGKYRVATIGNAKRSITAKVLSAKPVFIQEQTSGLGSSSGGAIGGAVAAESDNVAVIIAGVVAGMVIGESIEQLANTHEGTEYLIETENGALFTVAQINKGYEILSVGQNVILVYGYPTQLLPDPRNTDIIE